MITMLKTITFVTGNKIKVRHANKAVEGTGYRFIPKGLDIIEPREEETDKVVIEKARQAFNILKEPLVVEDSGIYIKALNGFPKTYVHFAEKTIGIKNIIKMLEGIKERQAEFRQSLAYLDPGMKKPKVFSYVDTGFTVADKIWSPKYDCPGFDRILIPPGQNRPLCTFSGKWRAERDARVNRKTIHYRQLVLWLKKRS